MPTEPAGRKPRMTRAQLAQFLTANGYPISFSTLNKWCAPAVDRGPPVDAWWGERALYDPDVGLAWAERRLRTARRAAELSATA